MYDLLELYDSTSSFSFNSFQDPPSYKVVDVSEEGAWRHTVVAATLISRNNSKKKLQYSPSKPDHQRQAAPKAMNNERATNQ